MPSPRLEISINGGPKMSRLLDQIAEEDITNVQTRYQGAIGEILFQYDSWGYGSSLCIDNGLNVLTAKNCFYSGTVDGYPFNFPKPVDNDLSKMHRVMCRQRFTWEASLPERPTNFWQFADLPRRPNWSSTDYATIIPGGYGVLATNPTDTGTGEDRSCHHPNWYMDKTLLRMYADADGCQPTSNRWADSTFSMIASDGYVSGYNSFSNASWRAGNTAIGRKFQLPHAIGNSDLAYEMWGDLYYRDSILLTGNYAAMYNGGNWSDWSNLKTKPQCASELRGIGRGLIRMISATRLDDNEWRKAKIVNTINSFDSRASDLFSVPFAYKLDMAPIKNGQPNPWYGYYYVPYWEMSFVAYAIDYAIKCGFVKSSAYLDVLMDFQEQLSPSTVGAFMPYWLYVRDKTGLPTLDNLVANNQANDREAELYVMGEILRRHGRTPTRPLDSLMLDESTYPIKNHAAFFIADSTRPEKKGYYITSDGVETGQYRDNASSASSLIMEMTAADLGKWDTVSNIQLPKYGIVLK